MNFVDISVNRLFPIEMATDEKSVVGGVFQLGIARIMGAERRYVIADPENAICESASF